VKISGAEFMEWYDNHFPDGYFFDSQSDVETHDDAGKWLLDPDETYDTNALGYLCSAGSAPELDTDVAIRRWRKARDFTPMRISVPKGREDTIRELLKAAGVKVDTP
jgi:hypothetical protein